MQCLIEWGLSTVFTEDHSNMETRWKHADMWIKMQVLQTIYMNEILKQTGKRNDQQKKVDREHFKEYLCPDMA